MLFLTYFLQRVCVDLMFWFKLRIVWDSVHKGLFLLRHFRFILLMTILYFNGLKIFIVETYISNLFQLYFRVLIRTYVLFICFRIDCFFALLFGCFLSRVFVIVGLFFRSWWHLNLLLLAERCSMAFTVIMNRVDLASFDKIRVTGSYILNIRLLFHEYDCLLYSIGIVYVILRLFLFSKIFSVQQWVLSALNMLLICFKNNLILIHHFL